MELLIKRYNPIVGTWSSKDGYCFGKIVANCHNIEFDVKISSQKIV